MVTIEQLTPEEAKKLASTNWWEQRNPISIAAFQLTQNNLCCPFEEFHKAVNVSLGRLVQTHEFAEPGLLIAELNKEKRAPTQEEVLELFLALKSKQIDNTLMLSAPHCNGLDSKQVSNESISELVHLMHRARKEGVSVSIIDGTILVKNHK